MFKAREVDHIAIVVADTDEALGFYRDVLGLPLLLSEELGDVGVRLTHLDMGNVRLQLVQPLTPDHPLRSHLAERGEGFHHVCWKVDDTRAAMAATQGTPLVIREGEPHPAPRGGTAAFLDPATTRGVLWEMTSAAPGGGGGG